MVNVGRAGAANLDVIQEVEYVKKEAKIVYLLECLQKTAPPVIIFCERKSDVDEIHEYLLVKGKSSYAMRFILSVGVNVRKIRHVAYGYLEGEY